MGAVEEEATSVFSGTERFVVRRRLGEGGFGVVYEAHDRARDATVALKVLRATDGGALYRFKQEFRKLTDVSHRNLVTLHELHGAEDRWFFAMEFVDGVDFIEWVRSEPNRAEPMITIASSPVGTGTSLGASDGSYSPSLRTVASEESDGASRDPSVASGSSRDDSRGSRAQSSEDSHPSQPPELPVARADATVFDGSVNDQPSTVPVHVGRGRPWDKRSEDRLRAALVQLAAGLDALHGAGLLHRDVKPSNVMVSRSGRLVLLDFGLVSDREDDHDSRVVGTPAYMSPEQATGAPTDESTDWYSVGVMLYEALTGELPFSGNPREILANKLTQMPADPRELAYGVPEDLASLCMALLATDAKDRPTGAEVLAALSRRRTRRKPRSSKESRRVFVGRSSHERALEAAFERARSGSVELVLLRGRSGTGKSVLARRFCDRLRSQLPNATVLIGQCYEQESVPFEALDSLIDALAQQLRAMEHAFVGGLVPPNAGALTRLFPVLQRVRSLAFVEEVEALDPQELRRKATAALRSMLHELARFGPVVLFVDNLQWGDVDSAQVFDELFRESAGRPILFVGTFRTEDGDPSTLWQWFDRDRLRSYGAGLSVLDVEPLSQEEALTVARSLVGDQTEAQRARAATIARESGGNPYFLDVLARHAIDDEAESAEGSDDSSRPGKRVALDDVLWAGAKALDDDARSLLQVLAVAGVPVEWSVARAAAALGDDAADALARLRAQRFAKVRRSTSRDVSSELIECQHDRVREAVSRRIDAAKKSATHAALAAALASSKDVEPDRLALHYEGAGMLREAAAWAETAAERAAQSLAFDRSARLFRKAIELRSRLDGAPSKLFVSLGSALANAGRGHEAAEAYLRAASSAPELEALELRLRAADPLLRSGHIDEGVEQLHTVLRGLGMSVNDSPQRALGSFLVTRAKIAMRGEEPATPRAAIDPRELLRVDTCRAAAQGLGIVETIRGAEFNTRHYLQALEQGEPYRVARAFAIEAGYSGTIGYSARARTRSLLARAREFAAKTDNPHALGMVWLCDGVSACMEGRWIDSMRACHRAIAVFRERCVAPWDLAQAQFYSLAPKAWTGELASIEREIPSLLAEYDERSDRLASTSLLAYLAFLPAIGRDDAARGRKIVDDAVARWSMRGFQVQHWWALRAHVECDLYEGDGPTSLVRLEGQWGALERSLLLRVQYAKIEALQLRGRALIAASGAGMSGRWLLARAERDAKALAREEVPWAVGLGALLDAGIAGKRGQREAQRAALERAERQLTVADMPLYAAAARYKRGALIGGDAGRALIERATREASVLGAQRIERASEWLAPGA
ncbi:MAG: protein kinase [Myxococcales bacterium]|nr:protein kinase [Myxococcales bacterium]